MESDGTGKSNIPGIGLRSIKVLFWSSIYRVTLLSYIYIILLYHTGNPR